MRLGYIGLGHMGGALARRLLRSRPLRVFDRDPDAVARLVAAGATAAPDPRALAAECDLVMTCLPTSAEVGDVLFGEGGLAAALRPGSIVADMTTGDPTATRSMAAQLAATGSALIDAPVAGSLASVEAGTIAIMLGGPPEVVARCRPVFEMISPNIFYTGAVGTAHVMKLVNNVVSAGMRAVLFEAVALAAKNGLPLDTCAALLNKGSARSHTTEVALPRVLGGDFTPSFTLGLMHKDVTLATRLGRESGTPMLVAGLVRELFQIAIAQFGAEADVNRLVQMFEQQSGARIAPESSDGEPMSSASLKTPRIVVTTDSLAPAAVDILTERGAHVRYLPSTAPAEALRAAVAEAPTDAILSRTVPVTAEIMDAADGLKVISKFGAGTDNIDVAAAAERGIPVLRAHGANALSVAELALMMMLMLLRNARVLDASLRAGRWDKSGAAGSELTGKRLGIVGCGAVGSRLAALSRAFAMPLTIYDPYISAEAVPEGAERVDELDRLLSRADIVSLHCPLTRETRGMIDDRAFGLMKPTAILINAARGAVVDEPALVRALERCAIAGAGLDAFVEEPPGADSPLWRLPNVVATPHVGGSTAESLARVAVHAVQNIFTILDGVSPDPHAIVTI